MPRVPPLRCLALFPTLTACTTAEEAGAVHATSTSVGATDPGPEPTTGDPAPSTDDPAPDVPTTGAASTTGSTSTGVDTGEPAGTSTDAPPVCGDGHVDPGEQCDDSFLYNSNTGACLLSCARNVCGDGFVHVGVEACDQGANNNDSVYGGCRTDCEWADHCGDHAVQPPEECDQGDANGTDATERGGVPCDQTCRHAAKLCFLSSAVYAAAEVDPNLADQRCGELADAAGLDNADAFRAWISDAETSPAERFTPTDLPYVLPNGVRVANSTAHLLDHGPLVGITLTEHKAELLKAPVWTGTAPDGTAAGPGLDCAGWDSNSFADTAQIGKSGVDKQDLDAWQQWVLQDHWTRFETRSCDYKYHIYCFEQ